MSYRIILFVCSIAGLGSSLPAAELPPASSTPVDYEKHIRPLLEAKCLDCHGEYLQESQFRLDRKTSLIRGGDSGEPAALPGNSAESHLIKLVAGLEADLAMPPDESERLTAEEIGLLRAWIDQGIPWPGPQGVVVEEKLTSNHWSFQPLTKVAPPALQGAGINNPLDAFIQEKLQAEQLSPNPPADRRTLIRRMFLDVIGMPPTPEQVQKFLAIDSDQFPTALIEHLLASPHYGERQARYWLDLVRFAETHGFETNRERPHAWPYRDYVIEAFNADKPYDQFILEQIAGDSLSQPTALGYLVAGPYDLVKSPDINLTLMQRHNELDDIINTTGTAFLGLTFGCARCHNHKFDPISQTDYYALQAIFAGVKHGDRSLPKTPEQREQLERIGQQIATLQQELGKFHRPASAGQLQLIDEDPAVAGTLVEILQSTAGYGNNPPGTARGQKEDAGGEDRTQNVSGGKYTWWKHQVGQPVLSWSPQTAGEFRLWLSWGCGFESHCQDARYVIDQDGNPATENDWVEITVVNQQHFADGKPTGARQPLWSGFYDAGKISLDAQNKILLVGGKTGTAITADVLLLESETDDSTVVDRTQPVFREAVQATGNLEKFVPHSARFVRFVIAGTNSGQPCLDELEIFSTHQNVALATQGSKATASGSLQGYPIHQLEHINDGKSGNNFSWIADQTENSWVQIEFPQAYMIDRIQWARDREGNYADRLATDYRLESSLDGQTWKTISSSADRLPYSTLNTQRPVYQFGHLSGQQAMQAHQLLKELEAAQRQQKELAQTPQVYAGQYEQPGPTHRLYRGEPLAKREQVAPDAPAIFTELELPADAAEKSRRLALAKWIASPENPLTARVMVNRLWQYHFGKGLVSTASDFGAGGIPPSHPELLDWLAQELITHDWSLKHIHRLILQSATYQQASTPRAEALAVDAGTQLLWRYPPHRLEAEPIRDSILSVTGVLDLRQGGPGFSAFEVEAENVRHYHPKSTYGPADWRRMIYMTKVRMEQDAVFGVFDCPDAATSVPVRTSSTTPLQALNLFNSPFLLQQAELFATRLTSHAPGETAAQIRFAYELCYARIPSPEEIRQADKFIQQHGLNAFCRAMLNSNEFLFLQ